MPIPDAMIIICPSCSTARRGSMEELVRRQHQWHRFEVVS